MLSDLSSRQRGTAAVFRLTVVGLAALLGSLAPVGIAAQRAGANNDFTVHTADGKDHTGTLSKIASDWSIRLAGENPALIAGKDVVSLQRQGVERPAFPVTAQMVLSNGDRIALDLRSGIRLAEERLHVTPAAPLQPGQGTEWKLPIYFVAVLWIRTPEKTLSPERQLRKIVQMPRSSDIVFLRNGDRIEGTIKSMNSRTACKIEHGNNVEEVAFERIAGMAFSKDLMVAPPRRGPFGHVVLEGGSRLSLKSAATDTRQTKLVGKSQYNFPVEIPLKQLIALDVHLGRATYLSDLKPAKYQHEKFFGIPWPYAKDASVAGLSLRLKKLGIFDKGIGMHNGSGLTYNLDGKYQKFEALVGLDPDTGANGSARIRVLVDGEKVVFETKKEWTANHPPRRIHVSIQGAKTLTLAVEYGKRGNVQGDINWCNARLLK